MSIEAISDVLARMPQPADTHRSTPAFASNLPWNPSRSHETGESGTIPPEDVDSAIEAVSGAFEGLHDAVAEILAEKPGGRTHADQEKAARFMTRGSIVDGLADLAEHGPPEFQTIALQARAFIQRATERFDVTKPKSLRQDGLLAVDVLEFFTQGGPQLTSGDAVRIATTMRELIARSDKLDGFDTDLAHWREEVGELQSQVARLVVETAEVEADRDRFKKLAERYQAAGFVTEDNAASLAEQLATTRKANDDLAAQLVTAKGVVEGLIEHARPMSWGRSDLRARQYWDDAVTLVGEPDPTPNLSAMDEAERPEAVLVENTPEDRRWAMRQNWQTRPEPVEPRMVDKAPTTPRYQPTREEVDARIVQAVSLLNTAKGDRVRTNLNLMRWPVHGERGA